MGAAFCKKKQKQHIKRNVREKIIDLLSIQNSEIEIDNRGEIHNVSLKLIEECKYENIFQNSEKKQFFLDMNAKNLEFIMQIFRSFQIDFYQLIEEGYFGRKLNFIPNIYNLKKDIVQIFPTSYKILLKDFKLEELLIHNKFNLVKSVELENCMSQIEGIENNQISRSLEEFRKGKIFVIKNGFVVFKFEKPEIIRELIFYPSKLIRNEIFKYTDIYIKYENKADYLFYGKYEPKYDFEVKERVHRLFPENEPIISVMIKTSKNRNNIFSLERIDLLC